MPPPYKLEIQFNTLAELQDFIGSRGAAMSHPTTEPDSLLNDLLGKPVKDPIRKSKPWTQFEIDYIVENYFQFSAKEIGKSLHRPAASIGQMVYKLNKKGAKLRKNNRSGRLTSRPL